MISYFFFSSPGPSKVHTKGEEKEKEEEKKRIVPNFQSSAGLDIKRNILPGHAPGIGILIYIYICIYHYSTPLLAARLSAIRYMYNKTTNLTLRYTITLYV